jgi:hypothetical protein
MKNDIIEEIKRLPKKNCSVKRGEKITLPKREVGTVQELIEMWEEDIIRVEKDLEENKHLYPQEEWSLRHTALWTRKRDLKELKQVKP